MHGYKITTLATKWKVCLYITALAGLGVYFVLSKTIEQGPAILQFWGNSMKDRYEEVQFWWHTTTRAVSNNESLFVDEYFAPILDSFKNETHNLRRKHFRNGSIPMIFFVANDKLSGIFWKKSFRHITKNECPHRCILTDNFEEYNSSDAVVIYLRHVKSLAYLNERLPTRDPAQPWIVFSNESPVLATDYKLPFKSLNGIFNRTMLYRRDSDIVWTHGFIVSKKNAHFLPSSWHVDGHPMKQLPFHQRKPVVTFISNCKNSGSRLQYVKELSKFIPVDIFGKCGKLKCGGSRYVQHDFRVEKDKCLMEVAVKYLFYLSFENNICEDYATEKLYNIQYYPVVPVVYGGAQYDKLLPTNSYINALDFTPRQLADHLKSLAADQERYDSMLSWKEHYEVSTVGGERIYCQLCTKLYDPDFYAENTYNHFHKWFVEKSNCRYFSANFNTTNVLKIPYFSKR